MQTDPVIITGGMVLVSGEAGARLADIVLDNDRIADIVSPGTAQVPRTIDATARLIIPGDYSAGRAIDGVTTIEVK